MSLKRNLVVNYASQIYVTVIGIVIVPLYLRYMGVEAYGLIGFFSLLQSWFSLLDAGLTPTVGRESARFRGGVGDALSYRRLLQALEVVFVFIAIVGAAGLLAASDAIATRWIHSVALNESEVRASIRLMAIAIALRWICGLYRGVASGAERLVWLSGFGAAIATLRFVAVLPVLMLVDKTPTTFFAYQLAIAVLELGGLAFMARRLLPPLPSGTLPAWSLAPLYPVLKFSLSIAFTSSVWVIVTQTDKLVLSKVLPLAEYGSFTLAVLVASSVLVVTGPVSSALLPRMSRLEAEGNQVELIRVYRGATQLVAVISGTASTTLALWAEPLLAAWTGDRALAREAAPILTLYAAGNGVLAVSAFPYYLQYAKGNLRLHLIGNAMFVAVLLPAIFIVASRYGGVGAGYVWLATNVVSFFAWLPLVHHRFAPGINRRWYGEDVLAILGTTAAAGLLLQRGLSRSDSLEKGLIGVIMAGVALLIVAVFSSSEARRRIAQMLSARRCAS
jgi:O-antigen/teichoic acid export membrane protein